MTKSKKLVWDHFCVCRNGKYGIINNKGQDIYPCVFDSAFTDILHLPSDVLAVLEQNGRYGLILKYTVFGYLGAPMAFTKYIDPIYEAWLGQEFDEIIGTFTGDLRVKVAGKWGYLNKNAEFTTAAHEAYVGSEFHHNLSLKERGKYYRKKWWDEHPDEDLDIYYMDETNFDP